MALFSSKEIAAAARRSIEATLGTLRVDLDEDGNPIYRTTAAGIGESFPTFQAARDWIASRQFKKHEVIRPGVGLDVPEGSTMYPYGWYRYGFLEPLAEMWDEHLGSGTKGHIVRESFGLSQSNIEYFTSSLKRGGEYFGLPVIDKKASVLRLMKETGGVESEASLSEILDFMHKSLGFEMSNDPKVMKRLKTMMNLRGFSTFKRGELYKIGVFDPNDMGGIAASIRTELGSSADLLGELDEAVKRTSEGMSLIKSSTVANIATELEARAGKLLGTGMLEEEWDTVSRGTREYVEARRLAGKYTEQAARLREMAEKGYGRFNSRMMGLDYTLLGEVDPALADALKQGQIKGDFIITADGVIRSLAGGEDVDVITSIHNVKKEMGMSKARYLSLEEHELRSTVFMDIQTASSMPQLFSLDDLSDHMENQITDMFDAISSDPMGTKGGQGLAKAVREVLDREIPFDDPEAMDELQQLQKYARQVNFILESDGNMDVTEAPFIFRRFFESYHAQLRKTKMINGRLVDLPNFELPDTVAGAVVNRGSLLHRGESPNAFQHLRSGEIGLDVHHGVVLSNADMNRFYEAFGGFDEDDYLNVMLRYDEHSRRLKAVAYRQPNAMGEYGLFDVHDTALKQFLKKKGIGFEADSELAGHLERRAQISKDIGMYQKLLNSPRVTESQAEDARNQIARLTRELEEVDSSIVGFMDSIGHIDSSKLPSAISFDNEGKYIGSAIDAEGRMAGADKRLRFLSLSDDLKAEYKRILDSSRADVSAMKKVSERATAVGEMGERQARAAALGEKNLGIYSNARMLIDSWISQNEGITKIGGRAVDFDVLTQETAIDRSILPGIMETIEREGSPELKAALADQDLVKLAANMHEELGRLMALAHITGRTDLFLDPKMMELKGDMPAFMRGMEQGYKIFGDQDKVVDGKVVGKWKDHEASLDDVLLSEDDPKATLARLAKRHEQLLGGYKADYEELLEDAEYPEFIMNSSAHTVDDLKTAEGFLKNYDQLLKAYLFEGADVTDEELDDALAEILKGDFSTRAFDKINQESLRYLTPFFEDGVAGEKVSRVLSAAMYLAGNRGKKRYHHALFQHMSRYAPGDVDVFDLTAQALARAKKGTLAEGEELTGSFAEELANPITLDRVNKSIPDMEEPSFADKVKGLWDSFLHGRPAEDELEKAPSKFVDLTKDFRGGLKELFAIPTVRHGTVAAAGLAIFAGIYSYTKDRTEEDMTGPPLLPGGSAYENYPTAMPEAPVQWVPPDMSGVTYQVNARSAGLDPNLLAHQMQGVAGAPVSGSFRPQQKKRTPAQTLLELAKDKYSPI